MTRSRREFFTSWFNTVQEAAAAAKTRTERSVDQLLRPPGALLPDEEFLEKCTGCADCVTACPPKAIFTFETSEGKILPAIEPSRRPCLLCTDVPCVPACPEGALVKPQRAEDIRIGIARVNPRTCVTFKGQICDECFQACPYPHAAIMMIGGRPLVMSGACTGCGLCEKACPERPRAIAVIPERHLVPGLRVPKGEVPAG
ncbi:MAG: 4Fe-4S dicluster domain-containing protein [Thermoanaerobaculales bacterium]|nr:4Fe-4S dicluster domain-containing protein [Thermoanaerobaculales bacterium]